MQHTRPIDLLRLCGVLTATLEVQAGLWRGDAADMICRLAFRVCQMPLHQIRHSKRRSGQQLCVLPIAASHVAQPRQC